MSQAVDTEISRRWNYQNICQAASPWSNWVYVLLIPLSVSLILFIVNMYTDSVIERQWS